MLSVRLVAPLRCAVLCCTFLRCAVLVPLLAMATQDSSAYAFEQQGASPRYERLVLSEEFYSEGAAFGDLNGDGELDAVSGPYWYAGPTFAQRYEYAAPQRIPIRRYSKFFFAWTYDFNHDGRLDILVVGFPGQESYWYENPGNVDQHWTRRLALSQVANESPTFTDLTGDGVPELVCAQEGAVGYGQPDADPTAPWRFVAVTPKGASRVMAHGLGVGDVNGDGRQDLLEAKGWWEQKNAGELFQYHEEAFAESGGSQMFAYDFDGDGDNDVVSVQNAHHWGLKWFERRGTGADVVFVPHEILSERTADNPQQFAISQMHAMALADVDGDGVQDLITGKRYWAHAEGDSGSLEPAVLYWFRTVRRNGTAHFEPQRIDFRSGVGVQLNHDDINGDGRPDFIVGCKLGTFLFASDVNANAGPRPQALAESDVEKILRTGTQAFNEHVRTTEPLPASEQQKTFLLPEGFAIELFAEEPAIAKPMNMAFDGRGRLWVTSSVEYPFPVSEGERGGDWIAILEDADKDGRAEKVTKFADGLNIPIGLYPYRDGAICFSIPNIWFLRDVDGDGQADQREVLYGPFDCSRDTHGMCNSFKRGPDGWLYACHGFNNDSHVQGKDGHEVHMNSGNVFRMRLDGSRLEHFAYGQVNPFGMAFDASGDLFTADCHSKPMSLVLQGGYYNSFGKPHDGLGFVPDLMRHHHHSTGIAGVALGENLSFPDVYRDSAFLANVVTSRVNRNRIRRVGSTVVAEEEPDFIVCGDPWFRPVDLQVGPDGALYISDFYNRIIGHYEVDLHHPGRDRRRGRIWRVTYQGSKHRLDAGSAAKTEHVVADLTSLTAEALLGALDASSPETRSRILDQLTDRCGESAVRAAREAFRPSSSAVVRSSALSVLARLSALLETELRQGLEDSDSLVRAQAFRLVQSSPGLLANSVDVLVGGFSDPEPLVRRCAVQAAGEQRSASFAAPLARLALETPAEDLHLLHAVRMALRNSVDSPAALAEWSARLTRAEAPLAAEVALGIKTSASGDFCAAHVGEFLEFDEPRRAELLAHIGQFAGQDALRAMVQTLQERLLNDVALQSQCMQAIFDGVRHRDDALEGVLEPWALSLATRLLDADVHLADDSTIPRNPQASAEPWDWEFVPYLGPQYGANPWTSPDARAVAWGFEAKELFSSFPAGESATGILRSISFICPQQLSFFLAGHDAPAGSASSGKSFVCLKDALTGKILLQAAAPQVDPPQRVAWDTKQWAGNSVQIEIVDGDDSAAYAWLAVGRFSLPQLTPSDMNRRRIMAAELAQKFGLRRLRPLLAATLIRNQCDAELSSVHADALVALSANRQQMATLAAMATIAGAPAELRSDICQALTAENSERISELVGRAMQVASAAEQLRLAEQLCGDEIGVRHLLREVEAGRASSELLRQPTVSERLEAVASADQKEVVQRLIRNLPDETERSAEMLSERLREFMQRRGAPEAGKAVFKKHCAVCHQIGGQGAKVGPNLDGISSRGIERIMEDVLAPNRNVDVAFRATTVVLEDGRVFNGLVRKNDADQTVTLTNGQGETSTWLASEIAEHTVSAFSPMPGNVADLVTPDQLNDLWSYLMTVR